MRDRVKGLLAFALGLFAIGLGSVGLLETFRPRSRPAGDWTPHAWVASDPNSLLEFYSGRAGDPAGTPWVLSKWGDGMWWYIEKRPEGDYHVEWRWQ